MRPMLHAVLAATVVLLAGGSAGAHPVGSIAGRVTDRTGSALPGATVEAVQQGGTHTAAAVSLPGGRYRVAGLVPGTYRVTFRLGDLAEPHVETVTVAAGADVTLDVVLTLAVRDSIEVRGRRALKDLAAVGEYGQTLVGVADAATEGTVGKERLDTRPLGRTGELLEAVPGVIISQHSGEGKANQYYLRGFNLDHGTDLFTDVAGVPVNMPTHAHGQGYSDLNFLIPELVTSLQFRKGPYFAEEGDFAAAGAVHVNLARTIAPGFAQLEGGQDGYARAVVARSVRALGGDLLLGGELAHNDGPWVVPDHFRKWNLLASWSRGDVRNGVRVLAMAYQGHWTATDQVPQRAIDAGLIPRFGTLDPTDGGRSTRYSLSGEWQRSTEDVVTRASAFAMAYGLDLYNNFTYDLDDPENGDQFHQHDRRIVTGGRVVRQWLRTIGGRETENEAGVQFRNDNITGLALSHTRAREELSTTRQDHVAQTSAAVFVQNTTTWSPHLRTIAGLRADTYRFHVSGDNPLNSGHAAESLLSPKLAVILGPWAKTELYANAGYGFHSNDGRGSTIRVSPTTGVPVDRVSPLVRAKGAEVGVRTAALPGLESSVAVWGLDIDSELVFSGDAGETEASRASRRWGAEWSSVWQVTRALAFDADLSLSRARFTEPDPTLGNNPDAGNDIPGALQNVVSAGVAWSDPAGPFASARLRYFGPRPLVESGRVRSKGSTLVNAEAGWRDHHERWRVALELINVFGAAVSDIDYYYASRLPGEPVDGVNDIHTHPALPRTLRASVRVTF